MSCRSVHILILFSGRQSRPLLCKSSPESKEHSPLDLCLCCTFQAFSKDACENSCVVKGQTCSYDKDRGTTARGLMKDTLWKINNPVVSSVHHVESGLLLFCEFKLDISAQFIAHITLFDNDCQSSTSRTFTMILTEGRMSIKTYLHTFFFFTFL